MASADLAVLSPTRIGHTGRKGRRRRRRRGDKPAVSARLVLDDHVKSDAGILSEDLFAELFPQLQQGWLSLYPPVDFPFYTIANLVLIQKKRPMGPLPTSPMSSM